MVADINEVDNVARSIGEGVFMGGILYFAGSTQTTGSELWRSDGTDAGTSIVRNIKAGSESSYPGDFLVVDDTLYFTADDGVNGRELWKTNGTPSGTAMVKNIASGMAESEPRSLVNANGTLYFSADDGINGRELWKSNGSSSGTAMVRNLNTEANGDGIPYNGEILAVGSTVYFAGNTPTTGTELFKSDGTNAGTLLVRDVFRPDDIFSSQSSFPKQLTRVGSQVYFVASSMKGIYSDRPTLWVTNGTMSGTKRLVDSSQINSVTAIGTGVYFESGGSLFRTQVVNNSIISAVVKQGFGTVLEIKQSGGITYFASQTASFHGQLWKTDGTSSGTQLLKQFSGAFNADTNVPSQLLDWNGTLYFRVFRTKS